MHHFGDVSNVLKVSMQNTVIALHSLEHSIRQIARQTGSNRRTVRRYIVAADAWLLIRRKERTSIRILS
jgi:hypothetical protein